MIRKNIAYIIAFALLGVNVLLFNNAFHQMNGYKAAVTRTNFVSASFMDLSRQINNAAVVNPRLMKADKRISGLEMFYTDTGKIYRDLNFLRSTVTDSINILIINKLDSLIKQELPWILKSNVPDSILQNRSSSHLSSLYLIDSFIHDGINRTRFLLTDNVEQLNQSIGRLRSWILVFIILSSLLLIYTTFQFFTKWKKVIQSEKELLNASTVLNNAQEIARIGNWEFMIETNKLFWSSEMYKIWGQDEKIFQPTKQNVLNIIHPEDKLKLQAELPALLAGTKDLNIDHRILLKDGYEKWINSRARLIKDDTGEIIGAEGTAWDISEAKNAEHKTIESEKKYRVIIETAQEGIWQTDENNNVVFVNKYMAHLLGYTSEEMIGRDAYLFIDENAKSKAISDLTDRKSGLSSLQEITFLNKHQLTIHTLIQSTPIFNGDTYAGTLSMVLDITQRKKAEEKIINNEKRYRTLIENSTDGLTLIGTDGIVKDMSPSGKRILGYGSNEIIGNVRLDLIHEDDVDLVNNAFGDSIKDPENSKLIEYRHKMPDGNYKWLECSFSNMLEKPFVNAIVLNYRDITDRKNAENKLIESEAYYRSIIDQANDVIYIIDASSNILDINASGCKLLGYTRDELLQLNIKDILFEEDLQANPLKTESVFKGITFRNERRFKTKHGEAVEMEMNGRVIENKKIIVFGYDVTERNRAKAQLQRSEEKYRKAQSIGKMGHWELDLSNNKLFWSDEIYKLFGLEVNSIQPDFETFIGFVHPDDRSYLLTAQQAAREGIKPYDITHRIIVNNEVLYMHEIGKLVKDNEGKEVKFSGTVQDVTEQYLVEENNRFKAQLLNMIGESVMAADLEGNIIYWNKGAEAIYGWKEEEVLGKNLIEVTPTRETKDQASAILNDISLGKYWLGEFEVMRKNGTAFLIYVTVAPTYDSTGKVSGIISVATDITERKQNEQNLIAANEELRILSGYLQNIREDERKRMAREIHDELGQQLTAIKMDISWLNKRLTAQDDTHKQKIIEMLGLVDNTIKTVRKIATELRPAVLDDLGLIEAIRWQTSEFTKHTNIPVQFVTNIEGDIFSPEITTGVFRIFQESLTNIARHANATFVTCQLQKPDHHLLLTIKDNGIGFKVEQKTKRRSLGLLGMKERVNMLNGKYEITSEIKKGTIIRVSIPLV